MDRDDKPVKEFVDEYDEGFDDVTLSYEPETHWDRYKWYYITGGALIAGILIGSFLTRGSVFVRTNHGMHYAIIGLSTT